jgi:hypothetical protein
MPNPLPLLNRITEALDSPRLDRSKRTALLRIGDKLHILPDTQAPSKGPQHYTWAPRTLILGYTSHQLSSLMHYLDRFLQEGLPEDCPIVIDPQPGEPPTPPTPTKPREAPGTIPVPSTTPE